MNEGSKDEEGVIVDSNLTLEEALALPQLITPTEEVLRRLKLLNVSYYSFDGNLHIGQILVDQDLVEDVEGAFNLIRDSKFPIFSVIPIGSQSMTDDEASALLNNSCGFNYRNISRTNKLSNHSFGRAIDINPIQNPYIRKDYRQGGEYDISAPGTILSDGDLVKYFKERGWDWGGDWIDRKDYMHFEKPV